jgi:Ino eighty subunit 1
MNKAQPIKKEDADPLTREDVQYDLLHYIFSNQRRVFTSQVPGQTSNPRVNFCDLYVNALYNSSKCSKVLKEKMVETPAFAIELGKFSLLTNVGRINTTMACEFLRLQSDSCFSQNFYPDTCPSVFPEMKTALRTYHPVPSRMCRCSAHLIPSCV